MAQSSMLGHYLYAGAKHEVEGLSLRLVTLGELCQFAEVGEHAQGQMVRADQGDASSSSDDQTKMPATTPPEQAK
jgi:hypothetical protein